VIRRKNFLGDKNLAFESMFIIQKKECLMCFCRSNYHFGI
jgi:hypothetical protein